MWARSALDLTAVDTLVILMGVGALPRIAARLMSACRAADTPAAVIHRGTTNQEETIVGTLRDIAGRAARITAPAVVIVGAVVALRSRLNPGSPAWSPLIAVDAVGRPRG
jgi:siroheme synthase